MTNNTPEPMSDERLAELEESPLADAEDAAAEIRRLREVMNQRELDTMQTLIDRASDCDKHLKRIDELEVKVTQLAADREGLLPAWQKQRESLRGRIAHLEAELSNERIDGQKWRDYCNESRDG